MKQEKIKIASEQDFIKASRKGSREAEIELYGHPITFRKIFKNRKRYTRKKKYPTEIEDV